MIQPSEENLSAEAEAYGEWLVSAGARGECAPNFRVILTAQYLRVAPWDLSDHPAREEILAEIWEKVAAWAHWTFEQRTRYRFRRAVVPENLSGGAAVPE